MLASKVIDDDSARIPTGIFYQTTQPTYESQEPAYKLGSPAKQKLELSIESY